VSKHLDTNLHLKVGRMA